MWAYINEKFIEKNKSNDKENPKLHFEDDSMGQIDEIEGSILHVINNGELGDFSFDVELDDDDMIAIAGLIVKKLNKFKAVLESLKGE